MKYFMDCEFIEGFHKPLFGKRRHYIDLISIGIVCEDGREYYAISNEYNYNDASEWVKENVILPIYRQLTPAHKQFSEPHTFHKYEGKNNIDIRSELYQFIVCPQGDTVEFYGYYSDYDWVLFCSLFGRMMDLPKGLPMYCKDLKQTLDEEVRKFAPRADFTKSDIYDVFKQKDGYPSQLNEHNALDDAKWNMKLYSFLDGIK